MFNLFSKYLSKPNSTLSTMHASNGQQKSEKSVMVAWVGKKSPTYEQFKNCFYLPFTYVNCVCLNHAFSVLPQQWKTSFKTVSTMKATYSLKSITLDKKSTEVTRWLFNKFFV